VQYFGGAGEDLAIVAVMASHNIVGVDLFCEAINRSARRVDGCGKSKAVEGVVAIVATDDVVVCRAETIAKNFGEGFGNPFEAGGLRFVLEWKDENGLHRARHL